MKITKTTKVESLSSPKRSSALSYFRRSMQEGRRLRTSANAASDRSLHLPGLLSAAKKTRGKEWESAVWQTLQRILVEFYRLYRGPGLFGQGGEIL